MVGVCLYMHNIISRAFDTCTNLIKIRLVLNYVMHSDAGCGHGKIQIACKSLQTSSARVT